MIENGEELWLILIIQIINKRSDSVNIFLLSTVHDWVYNLSPLGLANILKLLVE